MTIGLFIVLLQKPRLINMDNAHLTTRMRTGRGVYFFHGLLILRYSGHLSFYQTSILFTCDTLKDNHSPRPVIRRPSP